MVSGSENRISRRSVLRATGGLALTTAALCQVRTATAQNGTASVTLQSQESDGSSLVIDSLQTEVDARLYITPVGGEDDNLIHKALDLSGGNSFTDRTVQLDNPIQESKTVSAVIQAGEGYDEVIAQDTAVIAIGESLSQAIVDQSPNISLVEPTGDTEFNWPYLLFTPDISEPESDSTESDVRPLVVGNSPYRGRPSEEIRRLDSGRRNLERGRLRFLAAELNSPAVVALIPSRTEDGSYQNLTLSGSTFDRLDLQVLAMVDDARERLAEQPYTVPKQFHAEGFSSNGRFYDKFTMLHPERINALSAGGNGIVVLPIGELSEDIPTAGNPSTETLPWPVGVGDLPELVDAEFDRDAWLDTNLFWYIGAEDQDPQNPGQYLHKLYKGDGEIDALIGEVFGSLQVDDRFRTSEAILNHLGASAEFTAYDGAGHEVTQEMAEDFAAFHRQQKRAEFGPKFTRSIEWPNGPFAVGESLFINVSYENLVETEITTTSRLLIDGEVVDSAEVSVASGDTGDIRFGYEFTSPGEYTVSIDEAESKTFEITSAESGTESSSDTDSSSDSNSGESTSTSADAPGFSLLQAITAMGGLGYLLKRRMSRDSD